MSSPDPFDFLTGNVLPPVSSGSAYSAYSSTAPNPNIGDMQYNTDDGQILIYSGDQDGWQAVGNHSVANWQTAYYVFKATGTEDNVGIWSGPLDEHNIPSTWTIHAKDDKFYSLDAKPITQEEYETQVAFETMPIMEIERESQAGVLLKFPD